MYFERRANDVYACFCFVWTSLIMLSFLYLRVLLGLLFIIWLYYHCSVVCKSWSLSNTLIWICCGNKGHSIALNTSRQKLHLFFQHLFWVTLLILHISCDLLDAIHPSRRVFTFLERIVCVYFLMSMYVGERENFIFTIRNVLTLRWRTYYHSPPCNLQFFLPFVVVMYLFWLTTSNFCR
jgi:hypothetical protein